jgi:hypothetical protein
VFYFITHTIHNFIHMLYVLNIPACYILLYSQKLVLFFIITIYLLNILQINIVINIIDISIIKSHTLII